MSWPSSKADELGLVHRGRRTERHVVLRGATSGQPTAKDRGAWIVSDTTGLTIPNIAEWWCWLELTDTTVLTFNSETRSTGSAAPARTVLVPHVTAAGVLRMPFFATASIIDESSFAP